MNQIRKLLLDIRKNLPDKNQKEYFEVHITRYYWILNFIKTLKLPLNSHILDVGCYPPHLFNALSALGYKLTGISSEHEKIRNKNVKIVNIENQPLPFSNKFFDFVLLSEVLEHLSKNPSLLFSEISRVLAPEGTLLITSPNVIRSQNLFKLLFRKNIYFPLHQLDENINHRHHREYTLNEIKEILVSSGLTVIKSGYFIAYSPDRDKNQYDSLSLKLIKRLNYFFMNLFPERQDTIFVLAKSAILNY